MKKSLKLQLSFLLGFLIFLITLYHLLLYISVKKVLLSSVDRHIMEDAKAFELSYFSGKGSEDAHSNYEVYTVRTPNGLILEGTENVLLPFDEKWHLPDVRTFKHGETFYRVLTYKRGDGFYVQYAINFTPEAEFLKTLKLSLSISWSILSLIILLTYLLLLRSLMTSIKVMSDALVSGRLDEKIYIYEELRPFFEKIREALLQLKDLSLRQRNVILGLSHSIKTPLSTTILILEDKMRLSEDDKLRIIRDELWRLERNVNAFLRMSKMENQQHLAKMEKCDLMPLVKTAVELYNVESGRIRLKSAEDSLTVICDRDILLEILSILMDNALLYSTKDSLITIWVSKEDKYASVCVENLAERGIDEEKLFKPFEGKYTGIGLYIAHRLTLIMNCKLRITQAKEEEYYRVKVCVDIPLFVNS